MWGVLDRGLYLNSPSTSRCIIIDIVNLPIWSIVAKTLPENGRNLDEILISWDFKCVGEFL